MLEKLTLSWIDKTTFEIVVTIPQKEIKNSYQETLKSIAKEIQLSGFRQGKAPLKEVEKKVGKERVYQELIKKIIPQIYQEAIRQKELKPIAEPKIILESASEKKDWVVKITSCVLPEIDLGSYQEEVKKINAQGKIWTPQKGIQEPGPKEKKEEEQKRLSQIMEKLIKTVKFELSSFLQETERQKRMVSLVDQLQKINLTIEQYLASKNQTVEQLKKEIDQLVENEWRLELILEAIADQEKIQVSQPEWEKIAEADQKKDGQPLNPYLLAKLLRRQKALEFLLNL